MRYSAKRLYKAALASVIASSLIFTILGALLSADLFVNLAKTLFLVALGLVFVALMGFVWERFRILWRRKLFRVVALVSIAVPILVIGSFFFFAAIQEKELHQGDLVISGDVTKVIDNKRLTVTGKVVVQDNATLKLVNRAYLEIRWTPDKPHQLVVKDRAKLIVENSTIKGGRACGTRLI